MSFREKIYDNSPVFIQTLLLNIKACLIKKNRFGKEFHRYLKFYEQSNYNQINLTELQKFIVNANNSKFWKNRFKKYDVDIYAHDIVEEIKKLPILTKLEVKQNLDDIFIDLKSEKISTVKTSGTTGSGLVFKQTKTLENKQWAVWWRYRKRFGIDFNTWFGWFGGQIIVPVTQTKPPYHRVNYPMKQVMFSAYHLKQDTVKKYYDILKKRNIKWLHGYPSQLSYFASLLKEANLLDLNIDYITLGAENLLEHQKKIIKEVFGKSPTQHYGLAEATSNISQMPSGELVIDQDFAYTELIPSPIDEQIYHIIGTNYSNLAFPLIRYDSNDLVTVKKMEGGKLKVINIDGRNEDFITLPNGSKIGRLDHIFKKFLFVKEAQIFQPSKQEVIFRIVKNEDYVISEHEQEILKEAEVYLGKNIKFNIKYYDKLERTSSGKLKFVISKG